MMPTPYYLERHYPLAKDYLSNPSFENLIDSLAKWDQFSKNDEANIIQAIKVMQFIQNQYSNNDTGSVELAYKYMNDIIDHMVLNHKDYTVKTLLIWLRDQGVAEEGSLYDVLCYAWKRSIEKRRILMNHETIRMRFNLEKIVLDFKDHIMKGNSESFIFYACELLNTYRMYVHEKATLMAEEILLDMKTLFVNPKVDEMKIITRNLYKCILAYLTANNSPNIQLSKIKYTIKSSKYIKANEDLISDKLPDDDTRLFNLVGLPEDAKKESIRDILFVHVPAIYLYSPGYNSVTAWLLNMYMKYYKYEPTTFYIMLTDFMSTYSVKIDLLDPDDHLGVMVNDMKKIIKELELQNGIDFAHEAALEEPLINPMYDRRELGFNEQELSIVKEAAKMIDPIERMEQFDQKFIQKNILTNLTPRMIYEHVDIIDFVKDFAIKYPHYIKPSLLKIRLENMIADMPHTAGTVLNEAIFELDKVCNIDTYVGTDCEYIRTYNLESMVDTFDKCADDLNTFVEELSIINDIARSTLNEEGTISWDDISKKLNGVRSDVIEAIKSNGPAVIALIKKAEEIADEKEKNIFIRTKILPPLKRIILIAASTGAGLLISPAAALLACVVSFAMTKNVSTSAKQSIVNEIEADMSVIDQEISEADQSSDTEKARNLQLLKKKLQVEYYKLQKENETASKDQKLLMNSKITNTSTDNDQNNDDDDF